MSVCACGHDKTVHVFGNAGCSACVLCDVYMPGSGPGSRTRAEPPFDGVPTPGKSVAVRLGLCVLSHPKDDDAESQYHYRATIGLLCDRHRKRLDYLTADIRDLWFDLALILEAGSAPKNAKAPIRHTKADSPPAPVNLDALVLRDARTSSVRFPKLLQDGKPSDMSEPVPSVLAVVASWLLLVAEERPLIDTLPSSVLAQLSLLARHHDWIAGQTWIADYLTEIAELRTALKATLRDRTHTKYGQCGHCGSTLLAENGTDIVRCQGCRASWSTPQELARLSVIIEGTSA